MSLLSILGVIDNFMWTYVGVTLILTIGLYFSIRSRFFQIRKFPDIFKIFFSLLGTKQEDKRGVHPIQVFFASVGGCIGIGNIIVVCVAVKFGGPGAVFWIWMTALLGMLIKYSEVYLGIIYRQPNDCGGYDGGSIYFLRKAFKSKYIPIIASALLCIYGVEVAMFSSITESLVSNWGLNFYAVVIILLLMVIGGSIGGIKRIGKISTAIIPIFTITFIGMSTWVLINNISALPAVFATIFTSAFKGHAAISGFAGSTMLMAASQGVARGCYTGDIGIGYVSVITSETSIKDPRKQSLLSIFGLFLDTFIVCTMSLLIVLVTGVWKESVDATVMVQIALQRYFPGMHLFMPFFIFLLGYSTMIAYLSVGVKCAGYLSKRWGKYIYLTYAILAFVLSSFVKLEQALVVMSLSGALLMTINITGIFRLRDKVKF